MVISNIEYKKDLMYLVDLIKIAGKYAPGKLFLAESSRHWNFATDSLLTECKHQ